MPAYEDWEGGELSVGGGGGVYEEVCYTPNDKLRRISELDINAQPESHRTNSNKEQHCLQYVDDFVRQFTDLHPERRPLMLTPRNECGLRKFVCNTLRPTQIQFTELYNYASCAKSIADFVTYEPLELAGQLPSHLPSPHATIQWQAGDSFDNASLLCSLLIGVGYDAYVVSGYAPLSVTMADRTMTALDAGDGAVEEKRAEEKKAGKYQIAPRKRLESAFIAQRAEAAAKEAKAAQALAPPFPRPGPPLAASAPAPRAALPETITHFLQCTTARS